MQKNPDRRHRRRRRLCAALLPLLLLLPACRPRTLYHRYLPVDPRGWDVTDTLRFNLPPATSTRLHTISLGIRFTQHMPWRDLYLVIEQRTLQHRRDTLHLFLANHTGRWQARGVVLHDRQAIVTAARLDTAHANTILVYHIMRTQRITGITEVGVKAQ